MTNRISRVAFSVSALILLVAFPVRAQTASDSIIGSVQQFFDAMGAHDTEALQQVMVMDGQYHAVREEGDQTSVRRSTFEEFVSNLSSSNVALLERMWEPTVLHHGPIAVVWTDYDFYRGGEFSHCGVDAFHVVRTDDGWKISSIVFTIEPEDCSPSPLGPPSR